MIEKEEIRKSVRLFYDLQKLRIQTGNRAGSETAALSDLAKAQHDHRSQVLDTLERSELKFVKKLCAEHMMFDWLMKQKGCGPTMTGVILSEVNIHRCDTISALWSFAGLSVVDGHAPRPKKGQKRPYNAFLRTKLVGVLADCMIKSNSPWRKFYDDYKHRKESTVIECMGCEGKGKRLPTREEVKKGADPQKLRKCTNCKGTGTGAWGCSTGHRHMASKRYMIKMFLLEMWKEWRTRAGLPVTPSYQEVYLAPHGKHGMAKEMTEEMKLDETIEVDIVDDHYRLMDYPGS